MERYGDRTRPTNSTPPMMLALSVSVLYVEVFQLS